MKLKSTSYSQAICEGFNFLLKNYREVFILGQGLWSPWYVGNSMKDLEKKFGKDRIIDTPISENAVTGAAVGASLCGTRPIVVHPRMDFMLYAMDPIVNQAAKWSYMFGGQARPNVTIRAIINRGGEQGAQHSQMLHSWFAHIPGLRVVMPYSVKDARDLLIASVLCNDPVIYIDDRWLYEEVDTINEEPEILDLREEVPFKISDGNDLTIVSSGFSTSLAKDAVKKICNQFPRKSLEHFDLRIISPLDISEIIKSVEKTGKIIVIDGGWKTCGLGSELISSIVEKINPKLLKIRPINLSLKECPAPSASNLEKYYYLNSDNICKTIAKIF